MVLWVTLWWLGATVSAVHGATIRGATSHEMRTTADSRKNQPLEGRSLQMNNNPVGPPGGVGGSGGGIPQTTAPTPLTEVTTVPIPVTPSPVATPAPVPVTPSPVATTPMPAPIGAVTTLTPTAVPLTAPPANLFPTTTTSAPIAATNAPVSATLPPTSVPAVASPTSPPTTTSIPLVPFSVTIQGAAPSESSFRQWITLYLSGEISSNLEIIKSVVLTPAAPVRRSLQQATRFDYVGVATLDGNTVFSTLLQEKVQSAETSALEDTSQLQQYFSTLLPPLVLQQVQVGNRTAVQVATNSPATSSSSSALTSDSSSAISGGAIGGIVIGVLVIAALIAGFAYYTFQNRIRPPPPPPYDLEIIPDCTDEKDGSKGRGTEMVLKGTRSMNTGSEASTEDDNSPSSLKSTPSLRRLELQDEEDAMAARGTLYSQPIQNLTIGQDKSKIIISQGKHDDDESVEMSIGDSEPVIDLTKPSTRSSSSSLQVFQPIVSAKSKSPVNYPSATDHETIQTPVNTSNISAGGSNKSTPIVSPAASSKAPNSHGNSGGEDYDVSSRSLFSVKSIDEESMMGYSLASESRPEQVVPQGSKNVEPQSLLQQAPATDSNSNSNIGSKWLQSSQPQQPPHRNLFQRRPSENLYISDTESNVTSGDEAAGPSISAVERILSRPPSQQPREAVEVVQSSDLFLDDEEDDYESSYKEDDDCQKGDSSGLSGLLSEGEVSENEIEIYTSPGDSFLDGISPQVSQRLPWSLSKGSEIGSVSHDSFPFALLRTAWPTRICS